MYLEYKKCNVIATWSAVSGGPSCQYLGRSLPGGNRRTLPQSIDLLWFEAAEESSEQKQVEGCAQCTLKNNYIDNIRKVQFILRFFHLYKKNARLTNWKLKAIACTKSVSARSRLALSLVRSCSTMLLCCHPSLVNFRPWNLQMPSLRWRVVSFGCSQVSHSWQQ